MIKIGYRSDIRIVTSKDGYEKLKGFVENYLKEHNSTENLLESCDLKHEGKEQCYFGWNYVKWYENDYTDVDAIMDGLQYLEENDYSYRYMRIGEDREDYDESLYDADRESEPELEYPCFIREFDDDFVIDNIKESKPSIAIEENKESVDI